jgi:hypothetical protein
MACESGCLCDPCTVKARDFAFGHWGLDRPVATASGFEPALVSRNGYWYDVDDPDHLEVFDVNGYLYAERHAA